MDSIATDQRVKIVLIDDEERNRQLLHHLITKHCPNADIIGEASSVDEGFDVIKNTNPDLILLDISMPPENGFDLLKLFDKITFSIVFVTAYSEYAIQAIKYSAVDYLLKPIKADELKAAINKFSTKKYFDNSAQYQLLQEPKQHTNKPEKLFIHSFQHHAVILIKEITYLNSSGNYTEFYFENKTKIISSRPIKQYESILQHQKFYRIHKSYLVNLNLVKAIHTIDGPEVELLNGECLPIAHRRLDMFMKVMKLNL
jgi:two-component system LytT family response regulator